jgi:hypothetical protein
MKNIAKMCRTFCGCVALSCLSALFAGCATPESPSVVVRGDALDAAAQQVDPKPVLVVDLDDTVVEGGFWNSLRLALGLFYGSTPPLENAPTHLRELERDWNIVFVTARSGFLDQRTIAWLDRHEFPRAPVFFSSRWLLSSERREEYKSLVIVEIKQRGLTPRFGVGDKASDLGAYYRNDMESILLLSGPEDPDLDKTLERFGVDEIDDGRLTDSIDLVLFDPATSCARLSSHLDLSRGGEAPGT